MTRLSAVTDEIVQETFLQLWISRDKLAAVHAPKAWIFRIAANICYTYLKRLLLEKQIVGQLHTQTNTYHNDLLEMVHVKGMLSALEEGVQHLSPQRRKIYQLSREHGLTPSEIAETLSLSIQTVRNTLSSSLEQLRNFLVQKGYPLALVIMAFGVF